MPEIKDPRLLSRLNAPQPVITAPNPMLPGQLSGQGLNNSGQALTNTKNTIDIQNAPIERTGKVLNNQGQEITNHRAEQGTVIDRMQAMLQVRDKFNAEPSVKKYRDALPEASAAIQAPDTAAGDLSMVYSFGKTMDPGSVVKEGEVVMARGAGGIADKVRGYLGILNQGRRLAPEQRHNLIEAMRSKVADYNRGYTQAYHLYNGIAKSGGFDPAQVIGPHDGAAYAPIEQAYLSKQRQHDPAEVDRAISTMLQAGKPAAEIYQQLDAMNYDLPKSQRSILDAYEAARVKGQHGNVLVQSSDQGNSNNGFAQGLLHPFDRGAEALQNGVNAVAGTDFHSATDVSHARDAYFAGEGPVDQGTRTLGNIVGSGIMAAPFGGPLMQGAVGNALAGDARDAEGIAKDATIGAVAGKAGDLALRAAGAVIAPEANTAVTRLKDLGVKLTPGRMIGPRAALQEDLLRSYPIVGPKIDALNQQTAESLNRVPANRALQKGLGEQLPPDVRAGHDAVAYTGRRLGEAYDATLNPTTVGLDPTFITRMNYLGQRSGLRPPEWDELSKIVGQEVGQPLAMGQGSLKGRDYKRVDTRLGQLATGFKGSEDPYRQQLGQNVEFVNQQLAAMLRRQNPQAAQTLRNLDEGWANYALLRDAASKNVETGLATPGQFRTAVRSSDKSVGKGATARGEALMQDFASDASAVIPQQRGNSGTADRQNATSLGAWVKGAALAPLYSDPVVTTLEQLLLREPGTAAKITAKTLDAARRKGLGAAAPAMLPFIPGQQSN